VNKLLSAVEWLYTNLGNPKTKNIILLVLALMNIFGMVAPSTATALRDVVVGFVF
jgi:hypothetical protein